MSSEKENIELKSKEKNNTDNLNLSVLFFSSYFKNTPYNGMLVILAC